MKIDRNNYEAYLLDRMEGRLSSEGEEALRLFLERNPDCEPGGECTDLFYLEPEQLSFGDRRVLKKKLPEAGEKPDWTNFDMFSIARIEGDLDHWQEAAHEHLQSGNPRLAREWAQWQQTKLPVEAVICPDKQGLKRKQRMPGRMLWIGISSTAALVALVLGLLRLPSPIKERGEAMVLEDNRGMGLVGEVDRARSDSLLLLVSPSAHESERAFKVKKPYGIARLGALQGNRAGQPASSFAGPLPASPTAPAASSGVPPAVLSGVPPGVSRSTKTITPAASSGAPPVVLSGASSAGPFPALPTAPAVSSGAPPVVLSGAPPGVSHSTKTITPPASPAAPSALPVIGPKPEMPLSIEERPLQLALLKLSDPLKQQPLVRDRIAPLSIPRTSIHLRSFSLSQLADVEISTVMEDHALQITWFELAHSGLQGINRLIGSEMKLQASRNELGELSGIRFRSRILNFEMPLSD